MLRLLTKKIRRNKIRQKTDFKIIKKKKLTDRKDNDIAKETIPAGKNNERKYGHCLLKKSRNRKTEIRKRINYQVLTMWKKKSKDEGDCFGGCVVVCSCKKKK